MGEGCARYFTAVARTCRDAMYASSMLYAVRCWDSVEAVEASNARLARVRLAREVEEAGASD
jgi:hypothetical protein